jgi:hypothetical protein
MRKGTLKTVKTRSQSVITLINSCITAYSRIYGRIRAALVQVRHQLLRRCGNVSHVVTQLNKFANHDSFLKSSEFIGFVLVLKSIDGKKSSLW